MVRHEYVVRNDIGAPYVIEEFEVTYPRYNFYLLRPNGAPGFEDYPDSTFKVFSENRAE